MAVFGPAKLFYENCKSIGPPLKTLTCISIIFEAGTAVFTEQSFHCVQNQAFYL